MRATIMSLTLTGLILLPGPMPAEATPLGLTKEAIAQPDAFIEKVRARGGAVRRSAAVGPRGGAAVRRTAVGPRGAVSRTAVVGPRGNVAVRRTAVARPWVRPSRYWWRPGGAIAAGAAIGFVTAATAVAWAGAAPGPNMCWYYTDASRTQGFWDRCP